MKMKTAKIVGAVNKKSWSQVHVFEPEGKKVKSHGSLIAALGFKALKEEIEVSSFGKEIITRLQEMYYSNETESVFKKVSQTIESLAAEFMTQVELKIVMAVVWQAGDEMLLYVGRLGGGQAYLKRGSSLVSLLSSDLKEAGVVSGKLEKGDKLVIGTSQFFRLVDEEKLGQNIDQEEVQEIVDALAPIVHGEEKSSRAAAVVVGFKGEAAKEVEAVSPEEADKEEVSDSSQHRRDRPDMDNGLKKKVAVKLKKMLGGVKKLIKKEAGSEVFVRTRDKRQKSAVTVGVILLVLFSVSLGLAGRKRQKEKLEAEYRSVVEEVGYKYDEAKSLLELNPLRARSLLTDSKTRIEEYRAAQEGEIGRELEELLSRIDEALDEVQREYREESASEWFDFSLVKEGFKGTDWDQEEGKLWVWDEEKKVMVEVDLGTKASKVVIGDEAGEGELIGLAGDRGFVVGKDLVTVVDGAKGKVVAEVGEDGWTKIIDAVGFSSNLYLLDGSKEGQIYKYLGVEDGLGSQKNYLKGENYDFAEAVSMAIDASVWVLFSDGTIVKYTRGTKDAFLVTGLDKAFEAPKKIFTSPEVDNIYVFDQKQTRVVVIDKSGEYKAQYVWPGMAGVKDLVVSEELKKIFLLTGEKVFSLDLKD